MNESPTPEREPEQLLFTDGNGQPFADPTQCQDAREQHLSGVAFCQRCGAQMSESDICPRCRARRCTHCGDL